MKQDWSPEELAQHFTLTMPERQFLGFKTDAAELSLAVLLKTFQHDGRFPIRPHIIPHSIVTFLAQQLRLPAELFQRADWESRTARRFRDDIVAFCGYRTFRQSDEEALQSHLLPLISDLNPDSEPLREAAFRYLRAQRIVPPTAERLRRSLRAAVNQREEQWLELITARLPQSIGEALDELISTDADGESAQPPLLLVRSDLAELKEGPGAVTVKTVLEELQKLKDLRALNLPVQLFRDVPPKVITQYRRRAASEAPRELRRHPTPIRHALLAALCWQRQIEVTDHLVELLIHIAQQIGTHAETKVEAELLRQLRKVKGKTSLLFKIAGAARAKPDGVVKEVIYPVVPANVLDDLIKEAAAEGNFDHQVRLVTRNSYGKHYRRAVPLLLEALKFASNNETYRPIMHALELLAKYRGSKSPTFPLKEAVPLVGVVKDDWHDLVIDEKDKVNRIAYEMCVLSSLRDRIRCKEIWVQGAGRYCNPDDDLPQDFEQQRAAYYAALKQPSDAQQFTAALRSRMETALDALNSDLPTNSKVKIIISKKGKGRLSITPLKALPEPPNIGKLTAALVQRWPMTNLLDILKETEWRVRFTDAFRSLGTREVLDQDTRQRRLLLCLHGIGTNAGLKRMCSGGTQDGLAELKHVQSKYLNKDSLRDAIARVCNAIFAVRDETLWGEGTTACASDSKKFGAWDQNLMTEWHARYGGPGVMVYWHVSKQSVCIYSQLKNCSSSEVAAMIEGVLRHDTEMKVDKNFVDTHGQSEVGFAFCHLLGFQLLPRLKRMEGQKLYRPNKGEPEKYPHLQPILTRPINWELIEQQYDEMIKFATALRLGTADAESILRRFNRTNVQHPTYRALAEVGKAVKTAFLCDYLRLESLRREIHEGLQVIETWNSANDFILYGRGGEFSTNKQEGQELRMLCLHLLQVSLVYVNTLMMQQLLAEPEWQGRLTEADLRALTPLKWQHVNPYGTFTLNMQERLPIEVMPVVS